ncbi:FAD/NAD(P)-binding protein [Mycobacterium yunnanensis]|uniref:FAD/NAD(P)-binding protein n=2 Tax=Mycobacterium yunnanensis TaxID=368477 RepID=A0A9X2Z837_9MYCO|nr:FAD/NAD(P)-binding protein [Mycobacterium yunnanensis]
MSAVNLTRLSRHPLHVTVLDDRGSVGRGIAYGVRRPEYLLNVAARNMSALPDEPDHFLQWLHTRAEFEQTPDVELRERFIPRQIYGDYLRSIVAHHLQSPGELTLATAQFVTGTAVDVEPARAGCLVHLADRSVLPADRVVLATGNEPPAPLPGSADLTDHPAWIGDPWDVWETRLPPSDGDIVILGTGLSAVDAVVTLRELGWLGRIHAVSRHGWFPHAHFRGIDYPEFPPPGVDLAELGLRELQSLVAEHCSALHERNENPAIIVDKLRPHTQRIWAGFTDDEKVAFAKETAARWNVFRHRIAPVIHAQVTGSRLTGQLGVHAAGIARVSAAGRNRVDVELDDGATLTGDLVINATGPSTRLSATRSALLQNLLRRGAVASDAVDMGVRIDADHTVVDAAGERSPWLLAVGPMLRGTYWETVAVPELRFQARRVAETVLGATHDERGEVAPQLEYMI